MSQRKPPVQLINANKYVLLKTILLVCLLSVLGTEEPLLVQLPDNKSEEQKRDKLITSNLLVSLRSFPGWKNHLGSLNYLGREHRFGRSGVELGKMHFKNRLCELHDGVKIQPPADTSPNHKNCSRNITV
jgi:hypothetical protein